MVSFRNITNSKHNWIKKLRCILHDLNTMAKWILKSDNFYVMKTIADDKKLVNYFTESFYYKEFLEDFRKKNNINHGKFKFFIFF